MRRAAIGLFLAVMATLALVVSTGEPAKAWSTVSVNVVVTTAQCPNGGTPKRVNVSITDPGLPGSVGSNWSGNTVYGLKTWYGYQSLLQGSNFCQTTWYGAGYYKYWSTYRYIYGGTTYI